jgi:hypothetical protein
MGKGTTKRLGAALVGVALVVGLAGCYEHTVTVGAGAPHGPVAYDHWENFWLGGLIGHVQVDVKRICPSGDATIYVQQSFLNGLVSGLTGGIFTPTTVTVRCADGRRHDMALSAEDMASLAASPRLLDWVDQAMPERHEEVAAAQATFLDR